MLRHTTTLRSGSTAGRPIIMTCYRCHGHTLTFDESRLTWNCPKCNRVLSTEQAVNEISQAIVQPSIWQALMSGVFTGRTVIN